MSETAFFSVIHMFSTGISTWVSLFFAAVSCFAAVLAYSWCRSIAKQLRSSSARSLQELDAAVTACESSYASIAKTVKRINSRLAMEERRAQPDLPLDPTMRKAQLKAALARGTVRVVRDGG